MAMNVQFLKGTAEKFKTITPVATTFYYIEDTKALYLGDTLLSNEVTAEQFTALKKRVKDLEDWKAALTEISKDNGANDLVKVTVTTEAGSVKSVALDDSKLDNALAGKKNVQTAVDNKITKAAHVLSSLSQNANGDITYEVKELTPGDIGAQPAGNYKTTQTKVDDKGLTGANVLGSLSQNANGEITYTTRSLTPTDIGAEAAGTAAGLIAALDATVPSAAVDAGKGVQVTVTETDGKIEAVTVSGNYDKVYDALGAADAAEDNAKKYADDLKKSILGEGLTETFDTLKEIEDWINGAGVNATELTEAIAAETKARTEADAAINEAIAGVKATAEAAYVKPETGIARTDLAADVQTSLGLADSALQEHQSLDHLATKEYVGTVPSSATAKTVVGYIDEKIAEVDAAGVGEEIAGLKATKADKVKNATNGNFAGLDANGNLTDSGKKAADFVGKNETIEITESTSKMTLDTYALKFDMTGAETSYYHNGISYTDDEGMSQLIALADIVQKNSDGSVSISTEGMGTKTVTFHGDALIHDGGTLVYANIATKKYADDAAKAVQGSTTNTVKDCVDAINALSEGTATANKDIKAINHNVTALDEKIDAQDAVTLSAAQAYVDTALTWGSF